jgi:hypothetical protein
MHHHASPYALQRATHAITHVPHAILNVKEIRAGIHVMIQVISAYPDDHDLLLPFSFLIIFMTFHFFCLDNFESKMTILI